MTTLIFSPEVRKRVKSSSGVSVELNFCLNGCEDVTSSIG